MKNKELFVLFRNFSLIFIGICLGSIGFKLAFLILFPLFLLAIMVADEQKYRRLIKKQEKHHYS